MHDSFDKRRLFKRAIFWLMHIIVIAILPGGLIYSQDSLVTYSARMIKPRVSNDLTFEDVNIRIRFVIFQQLLFKLENKSPHPLEVDWSRASFVDTNGTAHKVMHEGVRYIERDKALPPTVIPSGANISDVIVPVSLVSFESG